jgi:transcriptional regulator with XRE-family HTH domain
MLNGDSMDGLVSTTSRSSRPRAGRGVVGPRHDDVGRRLRARREEANLSLRELARRLGISPSAISQIETGKSRPSVSTLYSMVSELGITLDELFAEGFSRADGRSEDPASAAGQSSGTIEPARLETPAEKGLVQRASSRTAIDPESGVHWERLTPTSDPDADFLYVTYDTGASSSRCDKLMRRSGREYGLILSGTLEVTVGFDTFELGPGDSISFDSTIPHRFRAKGDEPVHGVWFALGRRRDESPAAV